MVEAHRQPAKKKPSRAERNEARRRAILRQASRGFERAGYRATQIADVARAAEVAHGTVYRHFENKDDLFRAVVKRAVDGVLKAREGEDLLGLSRAVLRALDGRARLLGLEARDHAPEELTRLERGLEESARPFTGDERRSALWRAAILEAARQGGEGWAEEIAALFAGAAPAAKVKATASERATGWR